jgi:hypothetical protein
MTCNNHSFDAGRCPLCGQFNDCQHCSVSAHKGPCWCARVEIPDELLACVPVQLRNRACICHNCIESFRLKSTKKADVASYGGQVGLEKSAPGSADPET